MIITQMELQNITTHKKTKIKFTQGLNILSGENGTGKSSILRMIGFNLFDFLPVQKRSSKKSKARATRSMFIRDIKEDKKIAKGIIKVWIKDGNNKEYLIQRVLKKTGTSTGVLIYDAKTNELIKDISDSKEHFQSWIKKILGLDEDISLESVFKVAVGVNQGTFTEPFLRPDSEKTKYFDPILNIDLYGRVADKIPKLKDEYKDENKRLIKKQGELEGKIENSDLYETEIRKSILEEKRLSKQIETQNLQYKEVKIQFQKLDSIKNDIEKRAVEKQKQLIKQRSAEDRKADYQNQLDQANIAKKICDSNKDDYDEFIILKDKEIKLTEKEHELRKLKDDLAKLEKENVKINVQKANITKEIETINKKKQILPDLETKNKKSEEIRKKLDEILKKKSELETISNIIPIKKKKISAINNNLSKLEKQAVNRPKLEERLKKYDMAKLSLENTKKKIAGLEIELKTYHKNKKSVKGGNCPFLNEKCINLTQKEGGFDSLESFFEIKIANNEKETATLIKRLNQLEEGLKKLEKLKDKLIILKNNEKRIEELRQEKIELENELSTNTARIDKLKEETENQLQVKEEFENLKSAVAEFRSVNKEIKIKLPKLQKEDVKLLKQSKMMKNQIQKIEESCNVLSNVPADLKNVRITKKEKEPGYKKYSQNIKTANNLPKIKKELNKINNLMKSLHDSIKTLDLEIEGLNKVFSIDDYDAKKAEKESFEKELVRLENDLKHLNNLIFTKATQLKGIIENSRELKIINKKLKEIDEILAFLDATREWFKVARPEIRKQLIKQISITATELFQILWDDYSISLEWDENYNIWVNSHVNNEKFQKFFIQLSGGEQMAAALAVRMAILKVLTKADFAFFDEPTTNLDVEKRRNLISCIQNIQESNSFRQLFVISHDDTFEENADNVIRFSKDASETTIIS